MINLINNDIMNVEEIIGPNNQSFFGTVTITITRNGEVISRQTFRNKILTSNDPLSRIGLANEIGYRSLGCEDFSDHDRCVQ